MMTPKVVRFVAAVWPAWKFSEETLAAWNVVIATQAEEDRADERLLLQAVALHAARSTWPPTLHELLELVSEARLGAADPFVVDEPRPPSKFEAWEQLSGWRNYHYDPNRKKPHPRALKAIERQMGQYWADLEYFQTARNRERFYEIYEEVLGQTLEELAKHGCELESAQRAADILELSDLDHLGDGGTLAQLMERILDQPRLSAGNTTEEES